MSGRRETPESSSFVPCPACGRRVAVQLLDFHLFSDACRRGTSDSASPAKEQAPPQPPTKRSKGDPELQHQQREAPELHQREEPSPQCPLTRDARPGQKGSGQDRGKRKPGQDGAGGGEGEQAGGRGHGDSPDPESEAGAREREGKAGEEAAPGAALRPLMALFRRPSKTLWLIRHGHTAFREPLRLPGPARGAPAAGQERLRPPGRTALFIEGDGGRSVDVRLSALGAQQARALHARLLGLAADAGVVLVSPLTRALQTLCLALQGPAPAAGGKACVCSGRAIADAASPRHLAGGDAEDALGSGRGLAEGEDGVGHSASPAGVKPSMPCGLSRPTPGQRWRPCLLREQVLREVVFRVVPGAVEHVACSGDVPRPVQEVQREFDYPWLDFSQVPPSHGHSAEGMQRRETQVSLRRRVALFRDYVLALPYTKVLIVGHSTFFMELTGSRQRMAHCQIATLRI